MTYDTVVLSGGEVKGFILLGALDYLSRRAYLGFVTNWYGTSIGAIIVYLVAIGYTPREILGWLCSRGKLNEVAFSIRSAVEGNGATGFGFIQNILETMTLEKCHRFYTLGGLKRELGKRLCVVTYNKTDCETVCLTPETHPDIPCLIALRMSANFPNLFPRFEYMGKTWVDGGVTNNFPVDYATDDPHTEHLVGITVTTPPTPMENYTGRDPYNIQIVPYMIREMYMYLCAVHNELESFKITKVSSGSKILRIGQESPGLFGINMTNRDRAKLFEIGFLKARDIYEPITVENADTSEAQEETDSESSAVTPWNPEEIEDLTETRDGSPTGHMKVPADTE